MVEFSECPYEAYYGPEDDLDDWETVYASDTDDAGLTEGIEATKENTTADDAAEDMEPWTWLPDVVKEGHLSGEGNGVEITGVVAAVLDNRQKYGFEFTFYEVEGETPWEEVKANGPQTA